MKNKLTILSLSAGVIPMLVSCGGERAKIEEPINILWMFGEDISPWMPTYGDSTVTTPNIKFLEENGVTFTNCYSTCSVSSPCRSALVTGAMQTTIGMHNHRTGRTEELIYSLPEGIEVLPQIFRAAGFHTFNHGKDDFNWHYDWNDYWTGPHDVVKFYGKEGQGSWNDRKEGQRFFGEIELFGGKNHNKPANPVDVNKVKVPSYYPNTKEMQADLSKHYNQIIQTDNEIGLLLEQMKKDGVYDNTIIIFMSDNGYQSLRDKQFLYDGGIHMPFTVCCPGNPKLLERIGIKPGSIRTDMMSLLDVTATTLKLAGLEVLEYMESMDIFDKNYHRDFIVAARDRCDFTIDRIRAIRTERFKYIRNFMTDRPLMQAQYRDGKAPYKVVMDAYKAGVKFESEWLSDVRPAEELYDIVNDPDEVNNLANDPKYKADLEKMRNYLTTWIEETDDKGQYPESQEELAIIYKRWGERCVNPEYNQVKKSVKLPVVETKKGKKK